MVIQKNLPAIKTLNACQTQQKKLSKALEQLSSGYRINSAADDAAGLGVSQKMRAQIFEMSKCEMNVSQGVGVAQTADGALAEVSEMLRRVKELCVAAANGVYGMDERGAITNEVNQIIEEAERIFSGTVYNDINLFRYAGSLIDDPVVSKIYNEMVNPLGPGQLVEWGELNLLGGQKKQFDPATPPNLATATIAFADDIVMSDATTLIGKTIKIQTPTSPFYQEFTFVDPASPGSTTVFGQRVNVNSGDNVEDLMKRVAASLSHVKSASVTDNKVTFTFEADNDSQTVNGLLYPIPGGTGATYNGYIVSSDDTEGLKQVDGSGNTNNQVAYSDTITDSFKINLAGGALTADMVSDMIEKTGVRSGNTLTIGTKTITFTTGAGGPGKAKIYVGMTTTQLRDAIVTAVGTSGTTTAAKGTDPNEIEVTITGRSSAREADMLVEETTVSGSSSTTTNTGTAVNGLTGISVAKTQTASGEQAEAYKITLPADLTSQNAFGVTIGGNTYLFYKKSQFTVEGGYHGLSNTTNSSSSGMMIDIDGMTHDEVKNTIISKIASAFSTVANTSLAADGSITVLGKTANASFSCGVSAGGGKIYSYKTETTASTSPRLGFSRRYLDQERSVSFKVPTTGDFSSLDGSGFQFSSLSSSYFEFDSDGDKSYTPSTVIDISSITTLDGLRAALQAEFGTRATVTTSGGDTITIKQSVSSYTHSTFTDGNPSKDGAFSKGVNTSASVAASGGDAMGQPQTTIDFSSITAENRDDLLGKGFRVTCATCVGEYINVVFVHDKTSAKVPDSFEVTDPVTNVTRTIRNYAVELKNVTDGESIVTDLVRQLSPNLKHFTDVEVGKPASTLILKDKRIGDIKNPDGSIAHAEVLGGVFTNFTYDLTIEEVRKSDTVAPPRTSGGTEIIYRNMLIYAGSEPQHQWIPIHLPYLTAAGLNLEEPEDIEDAEDAMDLMERVHEAQEVISAARGRLGADQNRLEHTFNAIVNTNQQIQAAESRIRDADMAKVMAKFVAQSVLGEAQQSMLAHANQNLQLATKLLE